MNRFAILLDRSGSMGGLETPTVAAFNENVETIRAAADRDGQRSYVSYVTFGADVRDEFVDSPVAVLRRLRASDYRPAGSTPMFDAIGRTIERFRRVPDADDPGTSFMVLVVTDGEENSSTKFTAGRIRSLVGACQATDRWTFAFLVPPGHEGMITSLGVPPGNVRAWEATAAGIRTYTNTTRSSYDNYSTLRSQGVGATRNFFTTDMSSVKARDVKSLDDLTALARIWRVDREVDIRDFVEEKGVAYRKGAAHYQLTKDETVQPYKGILVMEKGKRKVYGGPEARRLLGLPENVGDVEVRPGNHANFDLFVQSTSVNRKLVRGTTLVYIM